MTISKKRLEEIQNIADETIDTSDIPELDDEFWETAKVIHPSSQKAVTLYIDEDILEWFASKKEGCQSLINHALRAYIKEH